MATTATNAKRSAHGSKRREKRMAKKQKPKKFDRMAILVSAAKIRERGRLVIVDARGARGSALFGGGGCQVRWEGNTATCTIAGCTGERVCAPKYIGIGRIRIYWCSCQKIDAGDVPVEYEPTPGSSDGW